MGIIANKLQQDSGTQPATTTSTGGVVSRALAQQTKPKEPNLIQGLAQDIARPFERIGGAVINALDLGNNRARGGQQPTVRPGAFGGEVEQIGYKGGEKLTGSKLAKDVVGTALEAGSMFIPGTAGLKSASTLAKVGKTAAIGGATGAAYGTGKGLQEQKTVGQAVASSAVPAIGGALVGGTLPILGKIAGELPKIGGGGVRKYASDIAENSVKKEIGELLTNTKGISNKVREASQKNVDLVEKLSDPQIYKGLKVVNSRVVPDEAIDVIDNRIDSVLEAKRKLLPEVDRVTTGVPRDVLRAKAIEDISGKYTPADEQSLIRAIDEQIMALPDTLKVSDIDKLRARFRASARNAKGLQKSSSEYAALENASRNIVFDITDNLKIPNAQEYKAINDYIRSMIETRTFLDKTLRAQAVKGGRLGRVSGRMIGAIAGSQGGVLGTLLGSEVGGAVADVLTNNSLGSSVKAKLIREITDDPEILKIADDLLKSAQKLEVPQLPSPTSRFRTQQGTGPTIQLGKLQSAADENAARFGKQYQKVNPLQLPAGNPQSPPTGLPTIQSLSSRSERAVGFPESTPSISRQNTQNTITTNVANSSIPGTIPQKTKTTRKVTNQELIETLTEKQKSQFLAGTKEEQKKALEYLKLKNDLETNDAIVAPKKVPNSLEQEALKNLNWDKIPEEGVVVDMPLEKLRVTPSALEKATNNVKRGDGSRTSGPIDVAMLKDGTFAISEGHHRAVQKLLQGDNTVKATVYSTKYSAAPDSIYDSQTTTFKSLKVATSLEQEAKKYKSAEEFVDDFRNLKLLKEELSDLSARVIKEHNLGDITKMTTEEKMPFIRKTLTDIWNKANKKGLPKNPALFGLPFLGQKQQGLENEEMKFLEPNVVEGVYSIPSRKVTVVEPDLEELGAILFGEIGNRPLDKKLLEARTIANIALNRAEKEGKSLAEVLRQPNQFQAYKGNQYNLYKSGKAATSTISKEKVDAVNKILDEIRQGTLKNNIGDNLSYAHRKDNTIRVYKDWSEQKKDLNNIK